MHLLWRRYSRSGSAPPWFYAVLGSAFVSLAIWAFVERDWLVGAIALAMVAVTVGGSRVLRLVSRPNAGPDAPIMRKEDDDDER